MRRGLFGFVLGLLIGGLLIASPEAQNYIWTSINGVPYSPTASIGGNLSIGAAGAINMGNAATIRTGTTANDTFLLQAYDVDGTAYTTLLTLTAGNTPAMVLDVQTGSLFARGGDSDSGLEFASNKTLDWKVDNTVVARFGAESFGFRTEVALGTNGVVSDVFLYRDAAAILQLGRDVNGTAVAQTLKAHDGITGTDIAGASLTLAGGRGTGAGAPGQVILQTSSALGSGTTAQTLATRVIIDANGYLTVGTSAGTGENRIYASGYYAGTTAGVSGTYANVTTVGGIVTAGTEPLPDPLTQDEINELRGLMAAMRGRQ